MPSLRRLFAFFFLGLGFTSAGIAADSLAARASIVPGAFWPDERGHHIQAHGGGILKKGDTYYWFGEDRGGEVTNKKPIERKISCYASKDLLNWEFRNQVIRGGPPSPEFGTPFVLERPKVFHNAKTGKFVMYVHLDDAAYRLARVGVYVSDTVDGDYAYVKSFRPLDQESRDIGQFVDDDGSAYLIFESRPTKGFFIARLSDDYLSVARETCFIKSRLEGGALVKYEGLYYLIGSWMSGWAPNNNQYATSTSLAGPWSEFKDIAPPAKKTYGSQSTLMLKVVGSKKTSVIFMGDIWRPGRHQDGRYLWMPLEIGDGKLWLPEPREWTLDLATGETRFLADPAPAATAPVALTPPPSVTSAAPSDTAYLFSYFIDNGQDGLRLAWSDDGLRWRALNQGRSFLRPRVGPSKLMRDPCIARGPDGTFHMVWTDSWNSRSIGYASSRDLITWSEQRALPVMEHEPTTKNCWAPELVYDAKREQFVLFWASTIPGRFPETEFGQRDHNNHRHYFTTTRDFAAFTPTALFFNPGFNSIDATILPFEGAFHLAFKDERAHPRPGKNIQHAVSDDVLGPYAVDPVAITPPSSEWVEGPTLLRVGEFVYVYYDVYGKHRYEALRTRDFKTWETLPDGALTMPAGIRHGTAFPVPRTILDGLLARETAPSAP